MTVTKFDIREILLQKGRSDTQFEDARHVISAHTIDGENAGTPAVSSRPWFLWVRENGMNGGVHQAFNPNAIPVLLNFPCKIAYSPKGPYRWMILDADWDKIINWPGYEGQDYGIGNHAPNHEWPDYYPGFDAVNVYPRAYSELRATPGEDLTIALSPCRYMNGNVFTRFFGDSVDLASFQPAAGLMTYVLVYLDKESGGPSAVAGDDLTESALTPLLPGFPIGGVPDFPSNALWSALVRLDSTQTTFTETDIIDVRQLMNDATAANLLGAESIGQFLYSLDGVVFTPETAMITEDYEIMIDEDYHIMVIE